MKYTDHKSVLLLADNIIRNTRCIAGAVEDLNADFLQLRADFCDDGIDYVSDYINSLSEKVLEAINSSVSISKQLVEFAGYLKSGKR